MWLQELLSPLIVEVLAWIGLIGGLLAAWGRVGLTEHEWRLRRMHEAILHWEILFTGANAAAKGKEPDRLALCKVQQSKLDTDLGGLTAAQRSGFAIKLWTW